MTRGPNTHEGGTFLDNCDYKNGMLPQCAPLAMSYTPMQQCSEPAYEDKMALARGTLFPGLDLPFMHMVNKPDGLSTPLCELMALDFVVHELRLYLDTHPDDSEAFQSLQTCIRLSREGRRRYVEQYGPISIDDMRFADSYTWIDAPWPWQLRRKKED